MNRIKSLVTVFAFSLLVMSLPVVASAQWGGNNRNNGGYGGNNGYYSNEQLKSTVKRLKNDSKDLAKFIDREFDRNRNNNNGGGWGNWGNWGGNNNRNQLKNLANDFKRAADRLEDRFDSRDLYKSQGEAQNVLNIANQLDRELRRSRMSYDIQNYWNNIQNQLNEISNAYRYNNNRGRGNGNNGGWRNRFPF